MANYECACRTSYFRVTDEEKYAEMFSRLSGEGDIKDFTEKDEHGDVWHAFGCYGSIYVEDEDGEESPDISNWFEELSKIVREGDACVYMEAGYEKLCYVMGDLIVAMHGCVEYNSLECMAKNILQKHGFGPDEVRMYY